MNLTISLYIAMKCTYTHTHTPLNMHFSGFYFSFYTEENKIMSNLFITNETYSEKKVVIYIFIHSIYSVMEKLPTLNSYWKPQIALYTPPYITWVLVIAVLFVLASLTAKYKVFCPQEELDRCQFQKTTYSPSMEGSDKSTILVKILVPKAHLSVSFLPLASKLGFPGTVPLTYLSTSRPPTILSFTYSLYS